MTRAIKNKKKPALIEEILRITGASGDKFDVVHDKSEQYLTKLIKVVKILGE